MYGHNTDIFTAGFLYGGGHIKSIDGNSFTFNGIGEYWLLKSLHHLLFIQVRFIPFGNTRLTVVSAIAIRHQSINIQVEARNGEMKLYVSGRLQHLPTDHTVYVVTRNGVQSLSGLTVANLDLSSMSYSMNKLFIRVYGSDTLFIIMPSGASIRISLQIYFLYITVELSIQFINYTSGLIGTFNGIASDDFSPHTTFGSTISEEEIYYFGLSCEPDMYCVWHALLEVQ